MVASCLASVAASPAASVLAAAFGRRTLGAARRASAVASAAVPFVVDRYLSSQYPHHRFSTRSINPSASAISVRYSSTECPLLPSSYARARFPTPNFHRASDFFHHRDFSFLLLLLSFRIIVGPVARVLFLLLVAEESRQFRRFRNVREKTHVIIVVFRPPACCC